MFYATCSVAHTRTSQVRAIHLTFAYASYDFVDFPTDHNRCQFPFETSKVGRLSFNFPVPEGSAACTRFQIFCKPSTDFKTKEVPCFFWCFQDMVQECTTFDLKNHFPVTQVCNIGSHRSADDVEDRMVYGERWRALSRFLGTPWRMNTSMSNKSKHNVQ